MFFLAFYYGCVVHDYILELKYYISLTYSETLLFFFKKKLIICIYYNLGLLHFPITKKKKKKECDERLYHLQMHDTHRTTRFFCD